MFSLKVDIYAFKITLLSTRKKKELLKMGSDKR